MIERERHLLLDKHSVDIGINVTTGILLLLFSLTVDSILPKHQRNQRIPFHISSV